MPDASYKPGTLALPHSRWLAHAFLLTFLGLAWLSYRVAVITPLFGDEAFYWLESRYLDWSYTDLPGWTAWQMALAEHLGGHSYFGVRWLSWLAGLTLPWQAAWLAWQLTPLHETESSPVYARQQHAALAGLLVLSMPLAQLLGVLALPDIWLLFFTLLVTNLLVKAALSGRRRWWFLLAVTVALAVNVHVRLWIWLFTAAAALLAAWPQWRIWKPLLAWVLPATVIGLLPVLIFNVQNDWALFAFQFSSRHPWRFQPENFALALSQIIVISPLVFTVWLLTTANGLFQNRKSTNTLSPYNRLKRWIILTAVVHWLFYALTGLFADGQRTSVHWMMASYAPVLALAAGWWLQKRQKSAWRRWLMPAAIVTGLATGTGMWLYFASQPVATGSRSARVLDNVSGWPQLAQAVKSTLSAERLKTIVADYFMTGAELGFELNRDDVLFLPHAKNIKHGRQTQLQLMGLLHAPDATLKQPALVVVEDSTLKLQDKGRWYTGLCQLPGSMRWLKTVRTSGGLKKFQLFRWDTTGQICRLPAIFYSEHRHTLSGLAVSGWTVTHQEETTGLIHQLWVHYQGKDRQWHKRVITQDAQPNPGVAKLFPSVRDPRGDKVGFAVNLPSDTRAYWLELRIKPGNHAWRSHPSRVFLVEKSKKNDTIETSSQQRKDTL